ncbi:hypothetical protein H4R19_001993 [Coemansia spiralis]|nr:hypothetical protein H4R19_001993 [Coemansia spiralis]
MAVPACAWRLLQSRGAQTARPGKVLPMTVTIAAPDGSADVPVTISRLRLWRPSEEESLLRAIKQVNDEHGTIAWREVARLIPNRTATSCRQRYERIIQHSSSAAEAGSGRGARRAKRPLASTRSTMSLGSRSPRYWTPEEVEQLRQLRAIYGNKWTYIATHMDGRTVRQCKAKYNYLRVNAGKTPGKRGPKPRTPGTPEPGQQTGQVWRQIDSDKLRKLIVAHGRYSYSELSPHFPGVDYTHLHAAAIRLMDTSAPKHRRWRGHERKALLQLVHEHNHDWVAVATRMPNPCTPTQCRLLYANIILGHTQQRRAWTSDERDRLARLVDLAVKGELEPKMFRVAPKKPTTGLTIGSATALPQRFQKIPGLPVATAAAPPPPVRSPTTEGPLPWLLIASHMDGRTAVQCRAMWRHQTMAKRYSADTYGGPWTTEEDRALYMLYLETPGRWTWILPRLPRRRSRDSVIQRHRDHIAHYVAMLRGCRGAAWDPLADGFEEVHLRCEIRAWYAGHCEGYRPQDPYSCPYDLDLTGRSLWAPLPSLK